MVQPDVHDSNSGNIIYFRTPIPEIMYNKLKYVASNLINNADALNMEELWLFGSLARGDFKSTSDIDLLVLVSKDRKASSLLIEKLDLREDMSYPHVDIIVREQNFIYTDILYFNKAVRKDKIVLWRRK